MSYERYKDFRLAPDDNGCWDVLDKEYQQKQTFPSKAAAKRWIDAEVADNEVGQYVRANTEAHRELAPQSEAPGNSVDEQIHKLLCKVGSFGTDEEHLKDMNEAKAKINRLIVKAYINGFSDGKKIRQKYEVGDIGGNYRITERFRRVGKNIKYKVVCTLCGAPMFRYSNKFNLRHKDCGALSNNLSKEQLEEK